MRLFSLAPVGRRNSKSSAADRDSESESERHSGKWFAETHNSDALSRQTAVAMTAASVLSRQPALTHAAGRGLLLSLDSPSLVV